MPLRLREELPSTDTPMAMLIACHGRVRKFSDTLVRLADHLAAHGVDDEARQAAANILRYFDVAAPKHHADEEDDLFPALLAAAGSRTDCEPMRRAIRELTQEHEILAGQWQAMKKRLTAIAAGEPVDLHAGDLARAFARRYQQHAAREEADVYPWADELLSHTQLDRIAKAMTDRRRD